VKKNIKDVIWLALVHQQATIGLLVFFTSII
jgi:hypothetical protein